MRKRRIAERITKHRTLRGLRQLRRERAKRYDDYARDRRSVFKELQEQGVPMSEWKNYVEPFDHEEPLEVTIRTKG